MDTSFVGGTLITGNKAYMIIPPELYKRLLECNDNILDVAYFAMFLTGTMRLETGYLSAYVSPSRFRVIAPGEQSG